MGLSAPLVTPTFWGFNGARVRCQGRPPLALGTAGAIRCYKTDTGHRARALIRDFTARSAPSNGADPPRPPPSGPWSRPCEIARPSAPTAGSPPTAGCPALADAWYAGTDRPVAGDGAGVPRSARPADPPGPGAGSGPRAQHRRPRPASSAGRLEARGRHGPDLPVGAVGICTLAARHDALTQNPVRAVGPVTGRPKKAPRALALPQLLQLRAALTYDDKALA